MIDIKNLIISQPSEAQLSAHTTSISPDESMLKCLLQPCSFSQALAMMEKCAVMQDDEGRFFKLDENCLFVWMQSYVVEKDEIVLRWWLVDDLNFITFNDLTTSKWRYTPWLKNGEVDLELRAFCDEILGVGNE